MFNNLKTFNTFANESIKRTDIDPYNEENWDDKKVPQRPQLLEQPSERSIESLRRMALSYVEERERNANGEDYNDTAEYMLEEVVKAFYGNGIFKYLNDYDKSQEDDNSYSWKNKKHRNWKES